MTNILVVFPKLEEGRSIKNLLVRSGFNVTGICTSGAQAVARADEWNEGIIVCGYKMTDMLYSQLRELLPNDFEMLALMQAQHIGEIRKDNIVCLGMPLKVQELVNTVNMMVDNMERRRRKRRLTPKVRNDKDAAMIAEAKELLMSRNHMTEEEAHRYIQRSSMDTGTNMVEMAQMVLTMMR